MEKLEGTKVTNTYRVTFDEPNPNFLCADNVALTLERQCPSTKFYNVEEITPKNIKFSNSIKYITTLLVELQVEANKAGMPFDLEMVMIDLENKLVSSEYYETNNGNN